MELYTTFIGPFDIESIKKNIKKAPNVITQSEAPAPEEIDLHKH